MLVIFLMLIVFMTSIVYPAVGLGDWLSMSSSVCMCCVHVLYGCLVYVVIICLL